MKPINEVDIDEMMRRNERAGRVYFAPAQMRAHKSTILDTRAIEHGTLFIDRTKDPYLGTQYKVKIQIQTGIVWPGNIANEPTLNAARRALAEIPNDYNPEEEYIANEPTLNAARRALAETPNDYNPEEEEDDYI